MAYGAQNVARSTTPKREGLQGCAGIRALSSYATTTEMGEIRELGIAEIASGKVFTARVDRFRVKDGKIVRWRDDFGAADI